MKRKKMIVIGVSFVGILLALGIFFRTEKAVDSQTAIENAVSGSTGVSVTDTISETLVQLEQPSAGTSGVPTFESMVKRAETWPDEKIESGIAKLEEKIVARNLIQKANQKNISADEAKALDLYLRQLSALNAIRMTRQERRLGEI